MCAKSRPFLVKALSPSVRAVMVGASLARAKRDAPQVRAAVNLGRLYRGPPSIATKAIGPVTGTTGSLPAKDASWILREDGIKNLTVPMS